MLSMQVSVSDCQGIMYTSELATSYLEGKSKELNIKTILFKKGEKYDIIE